MKLILENWRKYITEIDNGDDISEQTVASFHDTLELLEGLFLLEKGIDTVENKKELAHIIMLNMEQLFEMMESKLIKNEIRNDMEIVEKIEYIKERYAELRKEIRSVSISGPEQNIIQFPKEND